MELGITGSFPCEIVLYANAQPKWASISIQYYSVTRVEGWMIQLYSLATSNGQKIAIALEEIGLSYTPHTVNILKGEQFSPSFIAMNPNAKIPDMDL